MFKYTALLHLKPGATDADREGLEARLGAVAGGAVRRALLSPTLAGSFNGGDYVWHLQFDDVAGYRATQDQPGWRSEIAPLLAGGGPVAHVDSAAYRGGPGGALEPGIRDGVYRSLLLSVEAAAHPAAVRQFETELVAMGEYVETIRNWSLSPTVESSGSRRWTHVWEQDYADVSGLLGLYMMHPHHWGFIDRWFDPEMPERIVDTTLCHSFCAFRESVLGPSMRAAG